MERFVIEGGKPLHGATTRIIPDRIEAGTFLVGGAITGGDVTVTECDPHHLIAALGKLRDAGCDVSLDDTSVRVQAKHRPDPFRVTTDFYPGFPTDLQAQFMALMTQAEGRSVLTETIFENRFMHVPELGRMGAQIDARGKVAIVQGVKGLSGASVMATDLRASASLIIAGLVSDTETIVRRVYHLDRGYEAIENKLGGVGADIQRIQLEGP